MDIVFISQLSADTIIGLYDWEREIKQTVLLDIAMAHDNRPAAKTDDITHALNYNAVSQAVVAFIESSNFELIEALAEGIAELIQTDFSVPWVKLTLYKPGALSCAKDVGVIIERGET